MEFGAWKTAVLATLLIKHNKKKLTVLYALNEWMICELDLNKDIWKFSNNQNTHFSGKTVLTERNKDHTIEYVSENTQK